MDVVSIVVSVMSSLRKKPGLSKFWYACYVGPDGTRSQRSTKETNRSKALAKAVEWEKLARQARQGELTAAQARKVIAEMVKVSSGEDMEFFTVSGWLSQWIESKAGSASSNTMLRYRQVVKDFLEGLGERAEKSLAGISPSDITKFRDGLRSEGRTASTCNNVVKKVLNVPFAQAHRIGSIPTNPVAAVDALTPGKVEKDTSGRERFTMNEVVDLIEAAEKDWKGAIILSATTGLRLGDVASLIWASVDKENNVLTVETTKTGATVSLPMHPNFLAWLNRRTRGIGKAPVFPKLYGQRVEGCAGLSAQFRKIMVKAKIKERVTERMGIGRTRHSKGFHSLRHTCISMMADAGVPSEIRQKLVGHADERVHAGYTHHDVETLKSAVALMPAIAKVS